MDRIITFGEIMLRLKPPAVERFFQSPVLEATFGGGEANVAVSLCLLGKQGVFVTALPDNPIGDSAVNELRRYGVDVSQIKRVQQGRVGIYFLESGANQRPSQVVYDRDSSSISMVKPSDFNWTEICSGAKWFHVTGITPALSENAAQTAIAAAKEAKRLGCTVSVDLNYRKKLWNYGKNAPEVMRELVRYADIIIANEEDIQKCLGIGIEPDVTGASLDSSVYQRLIDLVRKDFPNITHVAVTLRESHSASHNSWQGVLSSQEGFYVSKKYEITDIVDRVGGGDSFSAALIFGLLEFPNDKARALEFAAAASALKHSISGDFNLTKRSDVEMLCRGDGSGRVQR